MASFEPVKLTCFALDAIKTARYNFSDKSENAEREKIGSMRAVSCSRRALAYFFDTSQSEYQAPARAVSFALKNKVVFFNASPISSKHSLIRLRLTEVWISIFFVANLQKIKFCAMMRYIGT